MNAIDVLISSCARPKLLDISIDSFYNYCDSSCFLSTVLVEDYMDDPLRRERGLRYLIEAVTEELFDRVVLLDKKAGVGFWWQEMLKHSESLYHIHLEDDNEFVCSFSIDKMLEVMYNNKDIIEIIFSRTDDIPKIHNPRQVVIDGLELTEVDSFSIAAGVFNTGLCINLLDGLGWKNKIHEAGTLTPKTKELGLRKFVLGHNVQQYKHIGSDKKYRKGNYGE